ncbi:MAG: threonine--tRNA ligase, partial [Planctomycetes bacterium]|nr:threonine--tRNA ligase [Planctomycetota bacterium]
MYAPMDIDGLNYYLKPMNCPGHINIYNSTIRSYRDLPIRYAELGTVYRYERSGALHGMLRVRGFTQDDAHIFCTADQLAEEIAGVCRLVDFFMKTFGFEYTAYLATQPKEKTIGGKEIWDQATKALQDAADSIGLKLELDEGGGAFYGPKIDYKIKDALGREWQNSTIQCDFNLPDRFELENVAPDGSRQRPIMLHRAILGSLERFAGVLIEHYGGRFPLWCSPKQVAVIPIREDHAPYARTLVDRLRGERFRVEAMLEAGHMNKKIKTAQKAQIPFMLIVGEREAEEGTVTVRRRDGQDQETIPFEAFLERIQGLRSTRATELS